NQAVDAELVEQELERGAVERGMARLEDREVAGRRREKLGERLAAPGPGAAPEHGAEVAGPVAEVVVDVDRGDPLGARPLLQGARPPRRRDGALRELRAPIEIERVHEVDEEQ